MTRPQRGDGRCKSPPEQGRGASRAAGLNTPPASAVIGQSARRIGVKSGGTADKKFALSHRLRAFFHMARQIPLLSGPSVQKMMKFLQ